jgi:exonuclease III
MNLKIVSWNVRGLNDRDKRLQVSHLLKMWRADIVCLQETKLDFIDRGIVRSLWGIQHVDWLYLGSEGASGGYLDDVGS